MSRLNYLYTNHAHSGRDIRTFHKHEVIKSLLYITRKYVVRLQQQKGGYTCCSGGTRTRVGDKFIRIVPTGAMSFGLLKTLTFACGGTREHKKPLTKNANTVEDPKILITAAARQKLAQHCTVCSFMLVIPLSYSKHYATGQQYHVHSDFTHNAVSKQYLYTNRRKYMRDVMSTHRNRMSL